MNLRLLVEHHEAQQVSEVWGPERFPLHHYFIAHGSNLGELQHVILTWENNRLLIKRKKKKIRKVPDKVCVTVNG